MADGTDSETCLQLEPAFAEALRAEGLDTLSAWMTVRGAASLDKPGLGGWRERLALDVGGRRLFLKRYDAPPRRERRAARRRGFRAVAEIEWHWLHRLRGLSIRVPEPVAFGYERRAGRERRSFIVTAAVPGDSLERCVRGTADQAVVDRLNDPAARRALTVELARIIRRLHGAALFHRDLYLSHIFLDAHAPTEQALTLIDLQRIVRPRWRRRRWRVKDLAALHYSLPTASASRAQRMRFFKHYCGVKRLSPWHKSLIRQIARKTRRIAKHDANRR